MRAVLQRVKRASVTVEGNITGAIEEGLLVLLGIEEADTLEDMNWLSSKLVNLRIPRTKSDFPPLLLTRLVGPIFTRWLTALTIS